MVNMTAEELEELSKFAIAAKARKKAKRREADFYPTPDYSVFALLKKCPWLLEVYGGLFARWLEPCYGDGAIIKAVARYAFWQNIEPPSWVASELRDINLAEFCEHDRRTDLYLKQDFLTWKLDLAMDVCLTNPPFSLAQEFVDRALPMADITIMLLPLGFLASRKRSEWWQGKEPKLVVLSERPSFVKTENSSTDRMDYAWYMWGAPSYVPAIQIAKPWRGFDHVG